MKSYNGVKIMFLRKLGNLDKKIQDLYKKIYEKLWNVKIY